MITYQCSTFDEYLALRESYPQFFTGGVSAPIPPPTITGDKGECEKMYNATFGKAFRFTRAQKEESAGMNSAELSAFRELKCAECIASGNINGQAGGVVESESQPPVSEGDAGRGAEFY